LGRDILDAPNADHLTFGAYKRFAIGPYEDCEALVRHCQDAGQAQIVQ